VRLPPPGKGQASEDTRVKARRDYRRGQHPEEERRPRARRSRAVSRALKREGRHAASRKALSRQARSAARRRRARSR
jgi:hypothetical protein